MEANLMDQDFIALKLPLTRDTRQLPHGHHIKQFTDTILNHDYMLCLISNDFIWSRNCMLEIVTLLSDNSKKVKILPVLHDEAPNIFNIDQRLPYYDYWKKEYEKAVLQNQQYANEDSINELKLISNIHRNLDTFFTLLVERNTKRLSELRADQYHELLNVIDYEHSDLSDKVWAFWQIPDHTERMRQLNLLLSRHQNTINGLFYTAWLNQNLGNSVQAYEQYMRFLEKYKSRDTVKNTKAHYNIALLMKDYFKDYQKAVEHLRAAIQCDPYNTSAYLDLAPLLETYYRDYAGAIQCYGEVIKLNPMSSLAFNNIGSIYFNYYADYKTAKTYFEKAILIDPKNQTARANLKLIDQKNSWLAKLFQ